MSTMLLVLTPAAVGSADSAVSLALLLKDGLNTVEGMVVTVLLCLFGSWLYTRNIVRSILAMGLIIGGVYGPAAISTISNALAISLAPAFLFAAVQGAYTGLARTERFEWLWAQAPVVISAFIFRGAVRFILGVAMLLATSLITKWMLGEHSKAMMIAAMPAIVLMNLASFLMAGVGAVESLYGYWKTFSTRIHRTAMAG